MLSPTERLLAALLIAAALAALAAILFWHGLLALAHALSGA